MLRFIFKLTLHIAVLLSAISLLLSCSTTKFVSEDEYLLTKVKVISDIKDFDASKLSPYILQQGNSKWFSVFKVPLGVYAMAGSDTSKWINRTLKSLGESPVVYDTMQTRLACENLRNALKNMGYLNADVDVQTVVRGKKLKAIYTLHPGRPFFIHSAHYLIQDDSIRSLLESNAESIMSLKEGMPFSVNRLDEERKRIARFLNDNGYYHFHKDFIRYTVDTVRHSKLVDVTMMLMPYRANNDSPETLHPRYYIGKVNYLSGDDTTIHLRSSVLAENTRIEVNHPYSATALQKTYNSFGRLNAVKYTNIKFNELADSTLLDCNIQVSTHKPNTLSFQPEGTNTSGDLGAAAVLAYENRNLFRGSETFSVQLRAAYEAITGLDGYQSQNYKEYNIESKLSFPRFIMPFISKSYRSKSMATSELSVSYNLQNRPEFHRRLFNASWRYRWSDSRNHSAYRFDVLDLNYIHMPWISSTFKKDYLDNANSRNAILRYNYEDLFIMKIGFQTTLNRGNHAFRANVETAGNLLRGASKMLGATRNDRGQFTLFNIAYAQYVKGDFDYTHVVRFDARNQLALHAGIGIAYPYGNSKILPFEKRYFAGGANSVRGWSVRGLGPGSFRGAGGTIDFINQTGDMKLDLNAEWRTFLFWKLYGAFFMDAGNIWTLRNYDEQPGGQFKLNEFYRQIAVAYGIGFRFNFDYFILRFDMGMKAVNPTYETGREHFPFLYPQFSRDFTFHFAVGLPF
ncbi:MAG: BamA/TamA family outer membrane protein [Prevotellaceae bacterium]|nr:BamA/TamA family outer membrane protein [Prevotella sp.]MDD7258426.1 BamA/TamA family outer membrane protein [Prevotellaceae bacterium]MDY6130040.1 BamA/TamA family outer membrane protein [Prevotella sp.]